MPSDERLGRVYSKERLQTMKEIIENGQALSTSGGALFSNRNQMSNIMSQRTNLRDKSYETPGCSTRLSMPYLPNFRNQNDMILTPTGDDCTFQLA